jgi:hypothetical protein
VSLRESFRGWCVAGAASIVAVVLAPFWFAGFIAGAFWWALRDGFVDANKQ